MVGQVGVQSGGRSCRQVVGWAVGPSGGRQSGDLDFDLILILIR